MNTYERARAYAGRIDSTAGQGGHAAAFSVALALGRGFGLPKDDAWQLLFEWNAANARPPWSEPELKHKLAEAISNGTKPFGYLLDAAARPESWLLPKPAGPSEAEAAAQDRMRWPIMRPPTTNEVDRVADLRHVPPQAVAILANAELIHVGTYQARPCFFLREGKLCQARAMDGQPLRGSSMAVKSLNLKGSRGTYFGAGLLGGKGSTGAAPPVLLVEGVVGLLEAVAAAYLAEADHVWTVGAVTQAGAGLPAEILDRLSGRRVRLVPDNDPAGQAGSEKLAAQLAAAGAIVDGVRLPAGCKDIGDILRDSAVHIETLKSIFKI